MVASGLRSTAWICVGPKGYCLAPPSKNYEWVISEGTDFDDACITPPRIQVQKSSNVVDISQFSSRGHEP